MSDPDLVRRLDRIEADLRALADELEEVRRLAVATAEAEPPQALPVLEEPPAGAFPLSPAETIASAWSALERGRVPEAVELARSALRQSLVSGDEAVVGQVQAFAAAAAETPLESALRRQVDSLADAARAVATPVAAAEPAARPVEPAEPPREAPVRAARPPALERLAAIAASELTGARAFALAGGVVTLLGIVFLFVLAANRGWIGPPARVSIGAAASLAALLAGMTLRVRYGRLQAALAAVGTGIAGGYATLAAATIIYGFVPKWGALLLAAAIAAIGGALALRWRSQLLAGLSLVGAAAAPGAVALDDGIAPAGTAFAVVVLAAAFAAAAPRRWLWLVGAVGSVALAQVAWLMGASPAEDAGAIAVAAAAALVVLAGALAWQATSPAAGADPVAAALVLASGGLALGPLAALLPADRDAGLALGGAAVLYGTVAYLAGRRWRDLGWVVAAVGLMLAAVATSLLLSERSLSVALAFEAAVLAALAWKLATPRFQLASLAYLAAGVVHALAVDVWLPRPPGDLPAGAAPGLYALAAAALVGGTLALAARRDQPALGMLAVLEPLWDRLVALRAALRLWLYALGVALAASATAAILSGRWLTLAWLAAAAALGLGATKLGERRLQAGALSLLVIALIHALAVESPLETLALARGADALAPMPSLAALAVVAAALAGLALFAERGIAFLGPLEGPEGSLALLGVHARGLRAVLASGASWLAVWAFGLLLVEASYEPGQAGASLLWAATGVAMAELAARRRWPALAAAAAVPALLAFGKAASFDWDELGDAWAAVALIGAAAGVLLLGFFVRYAAAEYSERVELASLACAAAAVVAALVAVDRLAPGRTRLLGAAALVVAAVVALLAVPPFRSWRQGRPERWLRELATVYWSLALVTLGFAEWVLVDADGAATVALWAVSAALVATAGAPLGERRLWLAGGAGSLLATGACLAVVTVPSRLVDSSAHPGAGLWGLAVCVLSLGWIVWVCPPEVHRLWARMVLLAVGLAVFALSLGVLELAERVSSASVATDFQRGHTAVSALWGGLALGLFIAGIVKAQQLLRHLGLALFGLALAKLFLYDLRNLSSITRALSFLAVGAILLAAAFFAERIIRGGDGGHTGPRTA